MTQKPRTKKNRRQLNEASLSQELHQTYDYMPRDIPMSPSRRRRVEQAIKRDKTRHSLTIWLVGMFTVTVVISGIIYAVAAFNPDKVDKELLMHWTSIVFPAELSLLSGAIGYYFGSKSKEE
jgi:hypothetical protein